MSDQLYLDFSPVAIRKNKRFESKPKLSKGQKMIVKHLGVPNYLAVLWDESELKDKAIYFWRISRSAQDNSDRILFRKVTKTFIHQYRLMKT